MEITEKDLEDLIFDALLYGGDDLLDTGLDTDLVYRGSSETHWYRQPNLGAYGIADIIGVTRYAGKIWVDVIELKNRPLKTEDFEQVFRYETAVNEIINNTFRRPVIRRIRCYLVGPSIETGHYTHNHTGITIFTFKFTVKGFKFYRHTPNWIKSSHKNLSIKNISYGSKVIVQPKQQEADG
jgi:hypothetical protein